MKNEFYINYEKALNRLQAFIAQGIQDDLDKAGIIQAFEFTFEQAWKAIQKKARLEGINTNSPKQALSWAIDQKWIDREKEEVWIQMLTDRNLSSHTYQSVVANKVAEHVENQYTSEFASLLENMKKN